MNAKEDVTQEQHWRQEVVSRVQQHRARRRRRLDPNAMELDFSEADSSSTPTATEAGQPLAASPVVRPEMPKIIEFRRPISVQPAFVPQDVSQNTFDEFELAEPVLETPRILEAPPAEQMDLLPSFADLQLESAEPGRGERVETPPQSAALHARAFAGLVDVLLSCDIFFGIHNLLLIDAEKRPAPAICGTKSNTFGCHLRTSCVRGYRTQQCLPPTGQVVAIDANLRQKQESVPIYSITFAFLKAGVLPCPFRHISMKSRYKFVITAALVCHVFLGAPLVISQAQAVGAQAETKVQAGKKPRISASEGEPVTIKAREQEKNGDIYTLRGEVEIEFRNSTLKADTITYNSSTGEITATGNLEFEGGLHDEHITASHGSYNVRSQTGRFYDVAGTTGARFKGRNVVLTSSSPIAFSGKMVEKTGPEEYVIHDGTITSCELPHPKWIFSASTIKIEVGDSAKIYNTVFKVKGVPVIYLPFASPPVERLGRQSGFLIH